MRNLTKTLAVVSLLIPGSVYPLGIGEIKLHSALNQNLDAEISLVLSPGEKVSDIKINLAPPDKFDDAGVPWSYFLSNVRFEAIDTSKGLAKIRVTSKQALKEPFLNFLLEVTWPKGSLYREFTVLVDPPETYNQVSVPVATTYQYEEPESFVRNKRQGIKRQVAQAKNSITGNEYGPTVKNDTLWKVAERVARNKGVSIEQMMIALYEENPRAFFKPNVNALLAGRTLKIPATETILRVSRQDALENFNRQTQVWKSGLTQSSPVIESASTEVSAKENQLKLVAPTQDGISENNPVSPADISKEIEVKKTDTTSLKSQEQATASSDIANNAGNRSSTSDDEALKIKVAALEKQMAAMQELLASKDKQLEVLQKETSDQIKPSNQPAASKTTSPDVSGLKRVLPAKTNPKTIEPKTVAPIIVSQENEKTDPTYLYLIGFGGAVIFSAFGWIWWRKRQSLDNLNLANIFTDKDEFSTVDQEHKKSDSETHHKDNEFTDGAGVFETDFSTSDFDVFDIDQGEIDPISEADVYLAYGRYQQAEDLIRHAINDQPERDEFKLKLLEIFYANSNKQAFEQYAENLAQLGKKDNASFWAKVTEMGSEICPNAELFCSGTQSLNLQKTTSSASSVNDFEVSSINRPEELIDNMEFDLASFEELFRNGKTEKSSPEENSLFNVFSLDNKNQTDSVVDEEPLELSNNESIDFDLSELSIPNESKPVDEESSERENNIEFSNFEFTSSHTIQNEEAKAHSLENIENTYLDNETKPTQTITQNNTVSSNYLDDDFDFNMPTQGTKGQFGLSDLTEMDEMETKLDLAIAYIDMSDQESAKEIAMEVLKKGTPEQQMIAQALLDGLK